MVGIRVLLILAVGWALGVASADTVAWWRFGDLAPEGGRTTAGMVLTNSADATTYSASPVSFPATFPANKVTGTDPAYMPILTNAFSASPKLMVYDPVSQTTNAAAAAMYCPWGGNKSAVSGGAKVPFRTENPNELLGQYSDGVQHDFTFECFFRATEEGLQRDDLQSPIAGIANPGNAYGAWSIVLRRNSTSDRRVNLWSRCSAYKKSAPNSYGEVYGVFDVTRYKDVTPDEWHHVAFIYTASNQTFSLYLDYKLYNSTQIDTTLFTNRIAGATSGDGAHLFLGRGTFTQYPDRSFNGDIAEARFSDVALSTNQFLRFIEPGTKGDRSDGDGDLLAWYSLDSLLPTSFLLANTNLMVNGSEDDYFMRVVTPAGGVGPELVDSTPGFAGVIRPTTLADEELDNVAALALHTNNCANSYLTFENAAGDFTASSFTLEFFFKTDLSPRAGDDVSWSYGLADSAYYKIILDKTSGRLFCRPQFENAGGKDWGATVSSFRMDDGQWHHLALVYDKQEGVSTNLMIFADGTKLYTWSGMALNSGPTPFKPVVGASRLNSTYDQFFHGLIDEVRLTRRARTPEEFLSPISFQQMGDVLVRIPFDGDSLLMPYGYQGTRAAFVTGTSQAPTNIPAAYADYLAAEGDLSVRLADTGACRFEGGKIAYPHIDALERSNITIEFFWRPLEKFAPWPCVLGLAGFVDGICDIYCNNGVDGKGTWMFYYEGTWSYARLEFYFATTTNAAPRPYVNVAVSPQYTVIGTPQQSVNPWYGQASFDGKWHHVAATLEEFEEGGVVKTRATTYFDYKKIKSSTLNGRLDFNYGKSGLVMQPGSASTARLATWDIDEVRITGRVLTPDQFCRRYPRALHIILR